MEILNGMQHQITEPIDAMPVRAAWPDDFPKVDIHAKEHRVKSHPSYDAAKVGDRGAAFQLVGDLLNARLATALRKYKDHNPVLVPIHGLEGASENSIPVAVAARMTGYLDYDVDGSIVQTSRAGHTGASGWWRLISQPLFAGDVESGWNYMGTPLKLGGKQTSATDSTPLPSPRPVTLSVQRMLTPSEIESLRRHKQETLEYMQRRLAEEENAKEAVKQ